MEFAPEKEPAAGALGSADDPMDEDFVNPASVFCIKLHQPKSNLLHKMSVPELCRTFRWQEHLLLEAKHGKKQAEHDCSDMVVLHCSPVSNFSAHVSPEAAAQSAATTTWSSGVTAVAFDPTCGGSVISVVIVEGQYMSPYDPDEGPSVTGWRVQRWESSVENVVIHQIFGNPSSSFGGQAPKQRVWVSKVIKCIPASSEFKGPTAATIGSAHDVKNTPEFRPEAAKRVSFDPFDLPSGVRTLARIVYSAHGGEIAVSFLRGGVHVFSGANCTSVVIALY